VYIKITLFTRTFHYIFRLTHKEGEIKGEFGLQVTEEATVGDGEDGAIEEVRLTN
jgi:hypothetical protein